MGAEKVPMQNPGYILLGLLLTFIVTSVALGWTKFDDGYLVAVLMMISACNQFLLAIFGLNSFYLIYLSCFFKKDPVNISAFNKLDRKEWPKVTIQLPIYNERFVIERLLRQVIKMDWPAHALEIQVLDDSTDGTDVLVAKLIATLQTETKIRLQHLRRDNREGYKAGALAVGTDKAHGEFLAIFDADFMPEPDYLTSTIPVIYSNPKLGMVQCRWGHLNYDHSLFTRLQAIGHDGHFIIEQYAKNVYNYLFNFNGTAGVWRRQCIEDAGGWSGDTLAEDLDLSYRAQLKGWQFDYLRDIEVKAEVPLSISAFKKQQFRWAKGSIQTALKLAKPVWNSTRISLALKVEALIHLFSYAVHPLMVVNLFLTLILFFLVPPRPTDYALWATAAIAVGPPMVVASAQLHLDHPERMLLMPLLVILHHGLCLSNSSAVLQAMFGSTAASVFERTPKFGEMQSGLWQATSYAQSLKSRLPAGEVTMFLVLIGAMLAGTQLNVNHYTYPWLFFFCFGFLFIIVLHLQEIQESRRAMADQQKQEEKESGESKKSK